MTFSQEHIFEIQFSTLSEPGDAVAGLLHKSLGAKLAIEQVLSGDAESHWPELLKRIGAEEYLTHLPGTIERFKLRLRHLDPERALQKQLALGGEVVFLKEEPNFAKAFQSLGLHAPTVLWLKGNKNLLLQAGLSIVGTRNATRNGIAITHQIVRELGGRFLIISGGARGIDTAAHAAALALGLPTIAFMAGGFGNLYPKENDLLFEKISNTGLLVSECAPDVSSTRWRFLQRNRLIAAQGKATVVVEAAQRSGARNTAGHAFACGNDVFAFSGPQTSEYHRGCNLLIKDGIAKPVADVQQLVTQLHGDTSNFGQRISSEQTRILDALSSFPRSLERICLDSGLSQSTAWETLQNLASNQIVFSTPRGWMLA